MVLHLYLEIRPENIELYIMEQQGNFTWRH